jgi:hypothetical protein
MKNYLKISSALFLILLTLFITSCSKSEGDLRAGSICTIENGDGTFGVVKVLVINAEEAHVKIYANKYDQRPAAVDLKTLNMGSIDSGEGFGVGHVPLARKGFDEWKPVEVSYEEVTKDDLEGYEMWKNQ